MVNPSPIVNLISGFDSINEENRYVFVCVYDSVKLDSGNPDFLHIWNTGSTEQEINVGTTGIGTSVQHYYVDVKDTVTGCATSDTINVVYSFAMCSYSINELNGQQLDITLYPNPVNDNLSVYVSGVTMPTTMVITDIRGRKVLFNASVDANDSPWQRDFDFTSLPPGTYLITFTSGGASHSEKVIKYK